MTINKRVSVCVMLLVLQFSLFAAEYELIIYSSGSNTQAFTNSSSSLETQLKKYTVLAKRDLHKKSQRLSLTKKEPSVSLVKIKSDESQDSIIAHLKKAESISHVEPNYPIELFQDYSDPDSYLQRDLIVSDAFKLWALDVKRDVIVAIIDTGIDSRHPDLRGSLYENELEVINGRDDDGNGYIDDRFGYTWLDWVEGVDHSGSEDDHGHGTHLAGIIAAQDNNKGVTGIHPEAKIMPLKVFNSKGSATQFEAAQAVRYAVDMGADIINCSWGYTMSTQVLSEALDYARDNGVIVVAAVGNASKSTAYFPASHSAVIGVGSVTEDGDLSSYSNYGTALDYTTLGNIYSTLPGSMGSYGSLVGTSQSTAVFSGILARLLAHSPELDASSLNGLLQSAAEFGSNKSFSKGYGSLDINYLLAEYNLEPKKSSYIFSNDGHNTVINNVLTVPNPVRSDSTTLYFNSTESGLLMRVMLYNLTGNILLEEQHLTTVGVNTITLDLSGYQNGMYLYVLKGEGSSDIQTGKCVVLR